MLIDRTKLLTSTLDRTVDEIVRFNERKLLVQQIKKIIGDVEFRIYVNKKRVRIIYTDFNKFDMSTVGRTIFTSETYGGRCGELYSKSKYVKWSRIDSTTSEILIDNISTKGFEEIHICLNVQHESKFIDILTSFENFYTGKNELVLETVLNIILYGLNLYSISEVVLIE